MKKFSVLLSIILGQVYLATGIATAAPDPFGLDNRVPPQALYQGLGGQGETFCQPPSPETKLELAEIVNQALCNNPQTREAWVNARIQAGLVGVSQSAYLPSVNASGTTSRRRSDSNSFNQNTASLTLSYLLYDFGGREANLENSQQLLNAALSTYDATRQTVFLSALQSFYQVHAAEASVKAALESERAAQESFKAAEARYLAGTATSADQLQARAAYSQSTLTRIKAEGALKNAQGILANVMGLDAQQPLNLVPIQTAFPDQRFESNLDTLVMEARSKRPDLQAAESRYKAAQANVAAVRADGMPSISLSTGPSYQSIDGSSTNSNSIGLTLNIPLFTGFSNSYKIRTAQAQAQASAIQQEKLSLQIALDVWQSYQNLLTATHTLQATADLLESSEASEKVALGRYKAGVGNILDVLNAQSTLANARQQRVQSAFDWYVSRASLAQAMGSLDSQLLDSPSSPASAPRVTP